MTDPSVERLIDAAARRYAPAGRFALHFARSKLRVDPVFGELLRRGLLPDGARLLDLGCGQALLSALLLAARDEHRGGRWPAGWPPPPARLALAGIEARARDVRRARVALGDEAGIEQGDLRAAPLPSSDVVVLLDVLHYLEPCAQDALLERIAGALAPGGLLLARVGDIGSEFAAAVSGFVDHLATLARGEGIHRHHRRALADWIAAIERQGFTVRPEPMSRGTPFANVLLVARKVG